MQNESVDTLHQKIISGAIEKDNSFAVKVWNIILSNSSTIKDCMDCLYQAEAFSLDFDFLKQESKVVDAPIRIVRNLLDRFCMQLGAKIELLCTKGAYMQPLKNEYCPFQSAELILYLSTPDDLAIEDIVTRDGEKYEIIDIKCEHTPYYDIWAYQLERKFV